MGLWKSQVVPLSHIWHQMACAGLDQLCLLARYAPDGDRLADVTNEQVSQLVSQSDGRFIGIASLDPTSPEAPSQCERAFTDLGLSGLYLSPVTGHYYPTDEHLDAIYDQCERFNKPVLFEAGLSWEPGALSRFGHPLAFEELAEQRPALRICLSGFAWPWVAETAMIMLKHPNVYTDTAALHFDNAQEFYEQIFTRDIPITLVDRSLKHQVMFGSGNPRFEQIRMAQALDKLGFRESTLELMRGQNAEEFIGVGSPKQGQE